MYERKLFIEKKNVYEHILYIFIYEKFFIGCMIKRQNASTIAFY